MDWLKGIDSVGDKERKKREEAHVLSIALRQRREHWHQRLHELNPMVSRLLGDLGELWFGRELLILRKYRIERIWDRSDGSPQWRLWSSSDYGLQVSICADGRIEGSAWIPGQVPCFRVTNGYTDRVWHDMSSRAEFGGGTCTSDLGEASLATLLREIAKQGPLKVSRVFEKDPSDYDWEIRIKKKG